VVVKLEDQTREEGGSLSGTLRLLAMLGVTALVLLAMLLFLGVIPTDIFTDAGGRALGVLALLAIGSVAVAWLMRGRG
jgi:hypothetical protein